MACKITTTAPVITSKLALLFLCCCPVSVLGLAVAEAAIEVCNIDEVVGREASVASDDFGPVDELVLVAPATLSFESTQEHCATTTSVLAASPQVVLNEA